jgi:hypothetical protein
MEKNKSLLQYCDELSQQGNTISIEWDGGNDSGDYDVKINGQSVADSPYTRALTECMDQVLEYGSWAGEYYAEGKAEYNPQTKCFEGTDNFSTEEYETVGKSLSFKVPKDIWFDNVDIEINGESFHVSLGLKNGYKTKRHQEVTKDLENQLETIATEMADTYADNAGIEEYEFSYLGATIERSEMKDQGDHYLASIENDSLYIRHHTEEARSVELDISQHTKPLKSKIPL